MTIWNTKAQVAGVADLDAQIAWFCKELGIEVLV